jgi:muconolactone delta-isomerase
MKLLALEHELPGTIANDFVPLQKQEEQALRALVQSGAVRETWFDYDRNKTILMLECDSVQEARAALSRLPFVAAGLIGFDVIALAPYEAYTLQAAS